MYEQLKLANPLCFRLYTAARLIAGAYSPYFEFDKQIEGLK